MPVIEIEEKRDEEKAKTVERRVRAKEDLEKVADTIVHSDFLRERIELLNNFFWSRGFADDGQKRDPKEPVPAKPQASEAWICFKNTIKFTRGLAGWPQEAVANWSALLMHWQMAIEEGALIYARALGRLCSRISALYMSVGITDEDKHGEYGIVRVGPKQFDKEPQKLL